MLAFYQGEIMNPQEFVQKIADENDALFQASRMNVRKYFQMNPKQEDKVDHFIGRMVNERMNMQEIAQQIAQAGDEMDPVELAILSKQCFDEAKHFRMVKEVIEHITKKPVDVAAAIKREQELNTAKGASLLEKYGAQDDPAALAAYQMVAEGRAKHVWNEMSICIDDDFIASRYATISNDEGSHAKMGARKLAQLATTTEIQERVQDIVSKMRKDLFEISCKNTTEAPGARELVSEAYGW